MNTRNGFDEAFKAMLNNSEYSNNYMFYAHMITHCKTHITEDFPAIAGVSFTHNIYNLYINPIDFNKEPIEIRLGILKHEMLHILYNHVLRGENLNHKLSNTAFDCAINQQIPRKHLPDYGIFPDTLEKKFNIKVKLNETSEYYYNLLKETNDSNDSNDSNLEDLEDLEPLDSHDIWSESVGDEALMKDITKKMIEKSIDNTSKGKGNLPNNISDILQIFTQKAQVSWSRELKNVFGNRRSHTKSTIMRQPRRFNNRPDLRGKIYSTTFDAVAVIDVSGSMQDSEIITCLAEIKAICKITDSCLKMIQVDTEVHAVEDFTMNTKIFKRSGNGGTRMEPAMDYIKESKMPCDLVILITDGGTEDISTWNNPPYKLIALTTRDDVPGIKKYKRYKQFNIKDV